MSKVTGDLRARSHLVIRVLVVLGLTVAIVFATQQSHAVAGINSSQGAGWNGAGPVKTVTATLHVPAINCSKVKPGRWLGEAAGVQILGTATYSPPAPQGDFAGVFLYCHGHAAHYRVGFITLNFVQFKLTFNAPSLHITAGSALQLTVTVTQSRSFLKITNISTPTPHSVTVKGPGFPTITGFKVGVFPLIDPSGGPILTGSIPASPLTYVNGPLTSTASFFSSITVNGAPLSSRAGVFRTYWYGKHGKRKARPTNIKNGTKHTPGAGFTVFSAPLGVPVLGKTMNAVRSNGTIRYKKPGSHKWKKLAFEALLPIGTEMDASRGYVQMTFGLPHHRLQTGVFGKGKFGVSQNLHTGLTNISLEGGNFGICRRLDGDGDYDGDFLNKLRTATGASATATTARKRRRHHRRHHKKVRSLWANAYGSYTTTGSYGAAAVLGTHWLTQDTCDGTLFKVVRDKIRVTVFYPHRHTVIVTQGHSFLAPAPPLPLASSST